MDNIITIEKIEDLPNANIYYISNINQYAIKINNITYRGNIGNIYNKKSINTNKHNKNSEHVNQILYCKYGNKCKTLLVKKEICNFYHDPIDILKLYNNNIIDSAKFNLYINTHKNFINTNWMYINSLKNNKNKSMRHFGSKDNIIQDIRIMKLNNNFKPINKSDKSEYINDPNILCIKNFKSQLIHDILVMNEIKKNNLVI